MKTFRGVFPAIVAPQDDKNSILFDVMGDLARRQVRDGAGGFLVNGHTGELSVLSGDERREAIRTVRAAVGKDLPIMAGVHTQGLGRKCASQCESAAECGADAVLVFSPFSFARGAFQFATDDARLLVDRDGGLEEKRGKAARLALYLFERDAAVALIRSG